MLKRILVDYPKPKYFLLFSIFYLILLLYINATYSFIGRGDYANYSNVARNLISGKGFSVDYLAWHFIQYPSLSHPEDMWPILQPVWIAISFLILGISPFAARLPNALFLVLLSGVIYLIGKRLFEAKVGFWSGVLTALNTSLITYSTVWITSDIALALFSLIIFYLGYLIILDSQVQKISLKNIFLLGLLCGLAILQKPMGALLPFIYFLFILFYFRRNLRAFLKPTAIFILGILLTSGPFFIRNLILFKSLFLPVEHYLGILIKYFPYERIFSIYYGTPPSVDLWLNYGLGNFLKVNFDYFRYSVDTFVYKDLLIPYPILVLSLIGLTKIKYPQKHFFAPTIVLFLIASALMATYWHYESRYYAMLIPVFNLLGVKALFDLFPKPGLRFSIVIVIIALITFLPSAKAINEGLKPKEKDPSQITYEWIRDNTPKDAVIMTLTPWELNFHSERKSVVIPNEDKETILWMAKKYGSNYLELEFLGEIKRPSLKDLYEGKNTPEFTLVRNERNLNYVYQVNWNGVQLDESKKPYWF